MILATALLLATAAHPSTPAPPVDSAPPVPVSRGADVSDAFGKAILGSLGAGAASVAAFGAVGTAGTLVFMAGPALAGHLACTAGRNQWTDVRCGVPIVGAYLGAVGGMLAGAALAGARCRSQDRTSTGDFLDFGCGLDAVVGGFLGWHLGTPVGAALGTWAGATPRALQPPLRPSPFRAPAPTTARLTFGVF